MCLDFFIFMKGIDFYKYAFLIILFTDLRAFQISRSKSLELRIIDKSINDFYFYIFRTEAEVKLEY